jgi:ParB-like chromosome segregation protein Spo0J
MTHYINTIEDFRNAKAAMEPVYLTSKSKGKILVPCANTLLVKTSLILANAYNPNSVSDDKMELLRQSIQDNGFCFPVVAIWDEDMEKFVIIDGFHRSVIVGEDWLDCDYIPLVVLQHDISQRMAATVQFNKARGVHQVDLDADVIRALLEQGLTEEDISTKLGMDMESVHRYKQLTGVAELFKNAVYSKSWDMVEESS